jgi:uncharacterized protein (DUF488 family)
MLAEAGGTATHLELTKWAFLLRREAPSGGGSSFYGFVPYKFGPFSFCLFQEMEALVAKGLVENEDERTWRLATGGESAGREVEPNVRAEAVAIVREFRGASSKELVAHVYARHPWYTVNSEIEQLEQRPTARPAVFTAGYESLSVDEFLDGAMRSGILRIVDVRNNPIARRYGFHRSTLARLAGLVGIDYVHVPELGIRSEDRAGVEGKAAFARLFEHYERTVLEDEAPSIDKVAGLIRDVPSVLVCMERAACDCHRSRLATRVAERTGLAITHIEFAS